LIFFWSFGIIDVSTVKCWKLSTAQPVPGHEGCCMYSYPSCTDSSLLLTCNFVILINASEG
jgi:hypothetical protein